MSNSDQQPFWLPTGHSPNQAAKAVLDSIRRDQSARLISHVIAGATVVDFGIDTPGSFHAGIALAKLCMGGLAQIEVLPCEPEQMASSLSVFVRTDFPLLSCLGCQYAGWPVQADDYFAMGSGPMRLLRLREPVLEQHVFFEADRDFACGVLESEKLPTTAAIQTVASDCGVDPGRVMLAIAPSTSIAGSIQIVARSVETAMHKLHEIGFLVRDIVSGTGTAPLPPCAKPKDTIGGIGRTNDAMLYGARVNFWVDCEDEQIQSIIDRVPSSDSKDHGRPFAAIFADYDHDFYQVDPGLFSPAVVTMHNLRTGRTFSAGKIETRILRDSFGV